MRAQPKASHFIDGEYVEDTGGTVIESIYPATGEVIARLHAATPSIVERAIAAAKRAQPEWAAMSPTARGRVLKRAAEIMRQRNRELSELETLLRAEHGASRAAVQKPAHSIKAIAKRLERDYMRVCEDVETLANLGLLQRDENQVTVAYDVIHTDFDLRSAA